jgi:hypothetical protein
MEEFSCVKEVLTALRNVVKAHRSLLTKIKILHRDISENNTIATDPKTADGFTGILIDLDPVIVGGERTEAFLDRPARRALLPATASRQRWIRGSTGTVLT